MHSTRAPSSGSKSPHGSKVVKAVEKYLKCARKKRSENPRNVFTSIATWANWESSKPMSKNMYTNCRRLVKAQKRDPILPYNSMIYQVQTRPLITDIKSLGFLKDEFYKENGSESARLLALKFGNKTRAVHTKTGEVASRTQSKTSQRVQKGRGKSSGQQPPVTVETEPTQQEIERVALIDKTHQEHIASLIDGAYREIRSTVLRLIKLYGRSDRILRYA